MTANPAPRPQVLSPVLLDDSAPPLSPLDAARLLAALCLAPREQLTIQRFGLACVRLREALASSSSSRYGHVHRTGTAWRVRWSPYLLSAMQYLLSVMQDAPSLA